MKDFKTIGVIGAGTMGQGIAQLLIQNNHSVILYDEFAGSAKQAKSNIETILNKLADKGKIKSVNQHLDLLSISDDLSDFAKVDLTIEAIIEDLTIKQGLFKKLEKICNKETVFCTNTSTLSINAIASALSQPNRLIGMHFFNPAPVMKLVEIIFALLTDSKIVEKVEKLVQSWGKVVVQCQSVPGFIVNRIARPFYAESLEILETSDLTPKIVDDLVKNGLNFKMGPFELMDLIGNDVNYRNTASVFKSMYFDKRFKPSLLQQSYFEAGLLGRKTNKGFYDYPKEESQIVFEPKINHLIQTIAYYQPKQTNPLFESLLLRFESKFQIQRLDDSSLENKNTPYLVIDDVICLIGNSEITSKIQSPVFCIDWAYDYTQVSYLAYCTNQPDAKQIVNVFNDLGVDLIQLQNIPGLVNARILAMLINEAADSVWHRVCSESDANKAVVYGLNYPRALLEWGEIIGWQQIKNTIDAMSDFLQLERYRVSPFIKQKINKW